MLSFYLYRYSISHTQDWRADWKTIPSGISKSEKNRQFLAKVTWEQINRFVLGTVSIVVQFLSLTPPRYVYPRGGSQSGLEGTFNILRGMGSGHGGLTCAVLLQRLGTKRISDESAILAKAQVQPDSKSSLWLKRRPKPAVSLIEITLLI